MNMKELRTKEKLKLGNYLKGQLHPTRHLRDSPVLTPARLADIWQTLIDRYILIKISLRT